MFEILLFLTFAVLCGLQPLLVKWFMPTTVKRNVIILCQELVKLIISLLMLLITSDYCIVIPDWTFQSAIWAAGVPSIMFVIQNHCNLFSNQILQPVTFVVLNQTKIVWTALWCYLLLKQSQSKLQIISLLLVIVATLYLRKILPLCCCCCCCSTMTSTSNSSTTISEEGEVDNNYYYDNKNETDSEIITSNESIEEKEEIERNKDGKDCELQFQQLHVPLLTSRSQSPTNNSISKNTTKIKINNNNDVEDNNNNYDDNENDIYEAKPKNTTNNAERLLSLGATLALFASFLSGLSGSITQSTLQVNDRNPHLFNIELSIASIALLIISTMGATIFSGGSSSYSTSSAFSSVNSKSPTKTTARSSPISSGGLFIGWTWQVWIPILSQAFSGILVGLVTKHLGAVTKSFGNIFGIAISSLLQQLLLRDRKSGQGGLSIEELVGACLCAISLWLHVTNPI
jgi:hypothetical protein